MLDNIVEKNAKEWGKVGLRMPLHSIHICELQMLAVFMDIRQVNNLL